MMIFNLHNSHIAVLTVLSSVIQIKKKLPSFPAEEKSVSDFTSEDKEIEYSPVTLAFGYDTSKGRLISEKFHFDSNLQKKVLSHCPEHLKRRWSG